MATMRSDPGPVAVGDDLAWLEIGPDGTEVTNFGFMWCEAQPLAGMKAWWVIPDSDERTEHHPAVLVARASRRHRAGRDVDGRWRATAGRYVDKGEWFRETDPRSRFARTFVPPRHVRTSPVHSSAQVEMDLFVRFCEEAERGR